MPSSTLSHSFSSIYFSNLVNLRVYLPAGGVLGTLKDLIVSNEERPRVVACLIRDKDSQMQTFAWEGFLINEEDHEYQIFCRKQIPFTPPGSPIFLRKHVLDKQIVDLDGKKLVRVNDVSLSFLISGAFPVAVDVGLSGLLRRLGIVEVVRFFFHLFNRPVSSQLILWNNIGVLVPQSHNIKLSVTYPKLSKLHPSDLSDIIEELDMQTRTAVFNSLDHERAADVLEEMDDDEAKAQLVEDMPVQKIVDVLKKMPSDEVADLLDDVNEERAEELLSKLDKDTSTEIRELMDYPENAAGSLMATDFCSFSPDTTAETILYELRALKPQADMVYSIYVIDLHRHLLGVVSLRDIVTSELRTQLQKLMSPEPIKIVDTDDISSLAETVTKYGLLSIPVVTKENILVGTIVIDDIMYEMIKNKRVSL